MKKQARSSAWILAAVMFLTIGFLPPPAGAQQEGYVIVEIQTSGQGQIQQVADLGVDIWQVQGTIVTAYVGPRHLEALRDAGLSVTVTVEDVKALLEEQAASWGPSALDYHTYATLSSDLYALEASGLAKVYNIGASLQGRDILAVRISDNPAVDEGEPAVLLVGCHHAREWISVEVAYYIALHLVDNYATDPAVQALVDNGEIWVLPMLNPDGHQYSVDSSRLWRKNRRDNGNGTWGVDLNRNYATGWGGPGSSGLTFDDTYRGTAPFSEPETQVLRDFFLDPTYNFKAVISYHSYYQLILYPWGHTYDRAPDHYKMDIIADEMEALVEAVHGKDYTADKSSGLYLASGTTDDWTYDVARIPSYTIELRPASPIPGFVLPPAQIEPTSEENIPAALYLIGLTQNDEDGDGVVEVDDNCLGTYNPAQTDSDGDTVGAACDCDDTNPAVQPGAEEQCSNSVDDDCDGLTDGDDSDCSSPGWGLAQSAEASADLQGAAPASRVMNVLGAFLLAAICLGGWRLARRRG